MQQKPSNKMWFDESGMEIPFARITKHEKLCETRTAKVLKDAITLNEQLVNFKQKVSEIAAELYASFAAENDPDKIGKRKGNMTFFNFDRTIKIEVSVNEPITFDDNLIGLAKEKLDQFIESNISGVESFIKDLILSAFATSRGRLDTKRVLSLKKHSNRIEDPRYHEAMNLIDKAIRKPESKTYFRIWVKDDMGQYKAIDLNFSSL